MRPASSPETGFLYSPGASVEQSGPRIRGSVVLVPASTCANLFQLKDAGVLDLGTHRVMPGLSVIVRDQYAVACGIRFIKAVVGDSLTPLANGVRDASALGKERVILLALRLSQ
ncbi:unnamed protein product, partial [Pleuronectes platessa]